MSTRAPKNCRVKMSGPSKQPFAPRLVTRIYRDDGRLCVLANIYGTRFTREEAERVVTEIAAEPAYAEFTTEIIAK